MMLSEPSSNTRLSVLIVGSFTPPCTTPESAALRLTLIASRVIVESIVKAWVARRLMLWAFKSTSPLIALMTKSPCLLFKSIMPVPGATLNWADEVREPKLETRIFPVLEVIWGIFNARLAVPILPIPSIWILPSAKAVISAKSTSNKPISPPVPVADRFAFTAIKSAISSLELRARMSPPPLAVRLIWL